MEKIKPVREKVDEMRGTLDEVLRLLPTLAPPVEGHVIDVVAVTIPRVCEDALLKHGGDIEVFTLLFSTYNCVTATPQWVLRCPITFQGL